MSDIGERFQDQAAVRRFVESVTDAYRALMGLEPEDDVTWKLGAYPTTGTIQVTMTAAPGDDTDDR